MNSLPVQSLYLDIFQKIKAMGLDFVSFYVDWALVEGAPVIIKPTVYLPSNRSSTQLKKPEYISLHGRDPISTPRSLAEDFQGGLRAYLAICEMIIPPI